MAETINEADVLSFDCPKCGRKVSIARDGTQIFHALPACDRWLKVDTLADATELMREAREKLEN